MKKLHLFIVTSFIVCLPVIVSAQDNIVAKKKQEEEGTKKAVEKKPVKPQPLPPSGKTIPPGMDVTKMVKKEFEKSSLAPKDASKPVEKKAEEGRSVKSSPTTKQLAEQLPDVKKSATTKQLAEKLPDVNPKPVDNGGYSKAPPPQNYGETKLYPSQEQYQNLPLKKSNELDNNLSTKKAANVVNQYDVVPPMPAYSNTPNNANKNNTVAGYDKPNAPLSGGSLGTMPNQNQYGELKLAPKYDVVPPENQYNAAQSKSAAEIKQERSNLQAVNPKSVYGPLPQDQNTKALSTEAVNPKSVYGPLPQDQNRNSNGAGYENVNRPLTTSGALTNQYNAAPSKSAAEIKQEQEGLKQQSVKPTSEYGPVPALPGNQNGNSNAALTKEKEMIEVRTYQSTGALVKQNEMAETKASKSQSEKTALTKEAELKEAEGVRAETERKAAEIKEAERVKAEAERKAAEVKEAERVKAEAEKKAAEIQEAKEKKVIEEREKTGGRR